jgi:hypothetical protein
MGIQPRSWFIPIGNEPSTINDEYPEVIAQQQRLAAVEAQLKNHPALQWGQPRHPDQTSFAAADVARPNRQLQALLQEHLARHWEEISRPDGSFAAYGRTR